MTWASKADVRREITARAKAAGLTIRRLGSGNSDCHAISDIRGRTVVVALKETGTTVERQWIWVGIPPLFIN